MNGLKSNSGQPGNNAQAKTVFKLPIPLVDRPASTRKEIAERLSSYSSHREMHTGAAQLNLLNLGFESGDIAALRGKRFLDLGCGAHDNQDAAVPALCNFEPWFCRYLFEAGAVVVGIDIMEQENEKFASYRIDLSKQGALSFVPDRSFDFISCMQLVDFQNPVSGTTSPSLRDSMEEADLGRLVFELMAQAHRILDFGGKLLARIDWGHVIFEKQPGNDSLVRII